MKPLLLILMISLAGALNAHTFDEEFQQARTAYDSGQYAEAAEWYESMLSNGVVNAEVHYNLANACFKKGDLPTAIWHYRKAWYTAPRDPDINANLHFALNAAGAVEPAPSVITRLFSSLSKAEWEYMAIAGYLPLCGLLLMALLLRKARRAVLKLCLLPVAALLVSAGGWWHWLRYQQHPEAVVVHAGVTALYAPVAGGTAYYKLPLGALVRQRNTDPKGWSEVEYDGKTGWVKEDNILLLSP